MVQKDNRGNLHSILVLLKENLKLDFAISLDGFTFYSSSIKGQLKAGQ